MPPIAEPAEPKVQVSPARQAVANWMASLESATGTPDTPPAAPDPQPDPPPAAPSSTPAAASPASPPGAAGTPPQPDPEADKWPRSAKEWKAFREARKARETELLAQIEESKKKVTDYETRLQSSTPTADPKELENLKKDKEELSKRLAALDVTQHPQFQQYFTNKTNAQLELAKRIVGPELSAKVTELLQQPNTQWRNEQLEEVFLTLSPTQLSRIGGVINALDEIDTERQNEIKNANENWKQLQATKDEKAKAQANKFEAMVNERATAAADPKDGLPAYQKREGDAKWNEGVEKRVARARALLTGKGVTPQEIIDAAFHAAALAPVLEDNLALRDEIKTLKAQVEKLSNAQPRPQTAQPSTGTENPPRPLPQPGTRPMDVSRNFAESMAKAMAGPVE